MLQSFSNVYGWEYPPGHLWFRSLRISFPCDGLLLQCSVGLSILVGRYFNVYAIQLTTSRPALFLARSSLAVF